MRRTCRGSSRTDRGPAAPTFWTGAFDKWAFAARGTSALWVAEGERQGVAPLTTSWTHGAGFPGAFDAHGIDDYSAWLVLPDALAFWAELGGDDIAVRATALLDEAVPVVDAAIEALGMPRSPSPLPASPAPQLRLVSLPDDVGHTRAASDALIRALGEQGVETAVVPFDGRGDLRLSAAPYNERHDYERLAAALGTVLASGRAAPPRARPHRRCATSAGGAGAGGGDGTGRGSASGPRRRGRRSRRSAPSRTSRQRWRGWIRPPQPDLASCADG